MAKLRELIHQVTAPYEAVMLDVVGQAGKRAWADAANECHCSLYLRARCKD